MRLISHSPHWVRPLLAAAFLIGGTASSTIALAAVDDACSRETARGDLGARLDAYLTRAAPFGFSGSVYVRDRDGVLIHRGYGDADRSRGAPVQIDTVFSMASITKVFTATAIGLLVNDGRLAFSDTLAMHFPDVPADKRDITIAQVLTHTSGLVDATEHDDYLVFEKPSFLRDLFAAPLLSPPGEKWAYSNAGFGLLAAIVETVSGQSYEDFLRSRIFGPAGMIDSGYHLRPETSTRAAHTYTPPVDHQSPVDRLAPTNGPHWVLLGNGGLLTTTTDLCRFDRAFNDILPEALRNEFLTGRFTRREGLSQGYAWTEENFPEGKAYHHGGDAPAYGVNSEYRRYPDSGVSVVFLGNNRHKGLSTRRSIVPAVMRIMTGGEAPTPPATVAASPDILAALAGSYAIGSDGRFEVRNEGGRLLIGAQGQDAVDVLTFQRNPDSQANRRVRNQRAAVFVDALQRKDLTALEAFLGDAAAVTKLMTALEQEASRTGALLGGEVLGTARLDRGVFRTTVRLDFEKIAMTLRFGWAGADRLGVDGDDAALTDLGEALAFSPITYVVEEPALATSENAFALYDLFTDQTVAITFTRAPDGTADALTFALPSGPVVARRLR